MSIRRLQRHRVTRGRSFLERKTRSLLNYFKKMNKKTKEKEENKKEEKNEDKNEDPIKLLIELLISSAEEKIKNYSHANKESRATSRIYNKLNTIERSLLRTINKITDKLEESGGDAFAEDDDGENKGYQNFRLFKNKGYETSFLSQRFSSTTVSITRDDVEDMKEKLDSFHEEVVEQKDEIASTNSLVEVYECLSDVYDLLVEIHVETSKLIDAEAMQANLKNKNADTKEADSNFIKAKMNKHDYEEHLENRIQKFINAKTNKEDKKFDLKDFRKECKENIFDPWKKEYETLCSEWYSIDTESSVIKQTRFGLNYLHSFWPSKLTNMLVRAI